MSSPASEPRVRRSVSLPPDLVREVMESGVAEGRHSFNKIVEDALRAYVRGQRRCEIEAALYAMADDPDMVRECAQIEKEFSAAAADGLDAVP